MTTDTVTASHIQPVAPGLLRNIVVRVIFASLVLIAAIFWPAGRLDWSMGWAMVAVYVLGTATAVRVMWRVCPDLLAERVSLRPGVKKWDIALSSLMAVWLPLTLTLGSRWAFIPAALFLIVTVTRAALEDRTLHRELAGYAEYAARVRYRLIPGVW